MKPVFNKKYPVTIKTRTNINIIFLISKSGLIIFSEVISIQNKLPITES